MSIRPNQRYLTIEDIIANGYGKDRVDGLRVLFIYANTAGDPLVPIGIPQLYAILKERGHHARLFDTTWFRSPFFDTDAGNKERAATLSIRSTNPKDVGISFYEKDIYESFEKEVAAFKPHLIAISALEMTAKLGFSLCAHIRKKGYYVPTIVGGEYATTSQHLVFKYDDADRAVDMMCVGEGEDSFGALLDELSRRDISAERIRAIPGIWTRDTSDHGYTDTRWGRSVSLNDLPIGDVDIFLNPELGGDPKVIYKPMYGKWWKSLTVEKARGCHFKCAFCCHDLYHDMYTNNPSLSKVVNGQAVKDNFRRDKSYERFVEDAHRKINRYGMNFVYVMDEDAIPPLSHDGLRKTIEFSRLYDEHIKLPFWIETRPETITPEVIGELSQYCKGISVGVESGSPLIRQKLMKRGMKQERILSAFKVLQERGIEYVSANFIIGSPHVVDGKLIGETREQMFESIELAKQIREINPRVTPVFNIAQPYRGTTYRKDSVAAGLISEDYICGDYRRPSNAIGLGDVMSKKELIGLHRCAALYVHFPHSRWNEVREAETDDAAFDGLFAEALKGYFSQPATTVNSGQADAQDKNFAKSNQA
jgi:radical SAM superfamily enzyme YgiQ (UPF0313 family)